MFTARYGLSFHKVQVDIRLHKVKRSLGSLSDAQNVPTAETSGYLAPLVLFGHKILTVDSTDAASQAASNIRCPHICCYTLINVPITFTRTCGPTPESIPGLCTCLQ